MLKVKLRVVPAGTTKLPDQVRVCPEMVGFAIAEPLKALVEDT